MQKSGQNGVMLQSAWVSLAMAAAVLLLPLLLYGGGGAARQEEPVLLPPSPSPALPHQRTPPSGPRKVPPCVQ